MSKVKNGQTLSAGIVETELTELSNYIHEKCPNVKVLVLVDDCCDACMVTNV
ncbi:hypothetical protein MNBD_CHLOROFLEXI01-1242 [hydrothermal vent metagenome]|uniref:Uncharacterized protein n=1 Tax=hydrothermal vent metagenome TaxID=652676 RepID=A0A3B0URE2_9ZZZZ